MENTNRVEIKGGSEKQNAWATEIVANWIKALDAEVSATAGRVNDGPAIGAYLVRLETARERFLAGLGSITAKQAIDAHTAKRSPVDAIITAARKG